MAQINLDAHRTCTINLYKVKDASNHQDWTWEAVKLQNNMKYRVNIRKPINWRQSDPVHNGVHISNLPTYQSVDWGRPGARLLSELQPVIANRTQSELSERS